PAGSVAGWLQADNTPQVLADGCDTPGSVLMWGNEVVGESILQPLGAGAFQFGKTYRITVCVRRFDNNPNLPQHVRFRFRVSNSFVPLYGVEKANGVAVVGRTPNTASTAWQTFTLPDWTANGDYDTLIVNPENDHAVNDGNF